MSSHDKHEHRFIPISANHPYYCSRCDQIGFKSSYKCTKSECNTFHHKECENPTKLLEYPFSTKCVLKFRTDGAGEGSLCDVCGKKIKGYHYRCMCSYMKRNVHPHCLSHEKTLAAADGLTLRLTKVASVKCMHCEKKDLRFRVSGWAYVSSCGVYCYHVSCVTEILISNWRNGFFTGKSDPFETIKERFPSDLDNMNRQVMKRNKERQQTTRKAVSTVLSVVFNMLTGNHFGLIGAAASYFAGS